MKAPLSSFMFDKDFLKKALRLTQAPAHAERIWTDTRTLKAGDLFAAIPGENFDGHDFVTMAAKSGAVGALVSHLDFEGAKTLPTDFCLIQVENTTQALRDLAKAHRSRFKGQIIAVAGSNGKTTTKEWIHYLLRILHGPEKVYKTEKSNNSILGIALSVLQLRNQDFAVLEIGIDEPGWMDKHLDVVAPNFGIITMIGEEHLNRLKNLKTVAEEELKVLHDLKRSKGGFVANMDSQFIPDETFPENTLSYSLERSADIEGRYLKPQSLSAFGLTFKTPLPGRHNAMNLLGALTMIRLTHPQLSLENLRKLASETPQFRGEAHRSLWLEFDRGIRVFDDCYNANPESMEKGLEAFQDLADRCHQKLVLGDMLDLGESTESAHQRILNLAIVSGADEIYAFGPHFAKAAKNSRAKIKSFEKIDDLIRALQQDLKPHDCIFLKGSRGMALERVLKIFESGV